MDTNPLAPDATVVLALHIDEFRAGLAVLATLTDGPVFVCQRPGPLLSEGCDERIRAAVFRGPHPAGLPGTHIHHLLPVVGGRTVWQINYQDVIAVGRLFMSGQLWSERIISIGGPAIGEPALVRAPIGADIDALIGGNLKAGNSRVISGSVLSGRVSRYLGRYHQQVSGIFDGRGAGEGPLSRLWRTQPATETQAIPSAIIPTEAYERVLPFGIFPIPLLRALSVGDLETARRLGCLELLEEDVSLLSYVCPSKINYAPLLRSVLDSIKGGD
jgi:Na+-transporting NADH:ubiquinone oxidoreductase subunit A